MSNDAYEYKENEFTEQNEQNNIAVSTSDVFNVIGKIFDYAREAKVTEREIERYKAIRDVAITKIIKEGEWKHAYLNKSFEERRLVIEKHFKLIQEGLERNNYDIVLKGMECVTEVVKTNPLKYLALPPEEQIKLVESGGLEPV